MTSILTDMANEIANPRKPKKSKPHPCLGWLFTLQGGVGTGLLLNSGFEQDGSIPLCVLSCLAIIGGFLISWASVES